MQIFGWPRIYYLHFPNRQGLPEQILTLCGAPEVLPHPSHKGCSGVPVAGSSRVPPTAVSRFAGAAAICVLSCLVLIQF